MKSILDNTPVTPPVTQAYGSLVASGAIEEDEAQRSLARRLDRLIEELEGARLASKSSSLGWLFGRRKPQQPVKGLYIHGSVGRGKSMLMDLFYRHANIRQKRRVHFNDFMAQAHERIAAHRRAYAAGETRIADPVRPVAIAIAAEARLLCFDEFSVTDIADAMLLGRLFSVLFEEGTTVVATSNVVPDELYRDGLNRSLFLPFIETLKRHCEVFELDARTDFRLEKVSRGQAWLSPDGTRARKIMESLWEEVAGSRPADERPIEVKGRSFRPLRAAGDAAWFSFDQLCREPRGALDYLAIVRRFGTVFIEGVPIMPASMRNEAKRFILLVDTLYDNVTRTVISAEANPHALYLGSSGTEAFEFQRTSSRLMEMQSREYLERAQASRTPSADRAQG